MILNLGVVTLAFAPAIAQNEQLGSSNDSNNMIAPKPSRAIYKIQSVFQPVTPVVPQTVASNVNAAPSLATAKESDNPFENFAYPLIKWKARYVNGMPGAIAQLTTTFEYGSMKYIVTLKLSGGYSLSRGLTFQFVDKNGFQLHSFYVGRSEFKAIPGTELMQAKGDDYYFPDDILKRIGDYSVNYP